MTERDAIPTSSGPRRLTRSELASLRQMQKDAHAAYERLHGRTVTVHRPETRTNSQKEELP